jgi:hypothetical protein
MTTERDDNLRHGFLHPDVIHGMWKGFEPKNRKVELNQDFLDKKNKYSTKKISVEDYLRYLLEMKDRLSREELIVGNTLSFLSSLELRERSQYHMEILRKQLIKIKDELYRIENKEVLKKIRNKSIKTYSLEDLSFNIFSMQADEAVWLLLKDSIYQIKSKIADILYDLHLLFSWSVDNNQLSGALRGEQLSAIKWWLIELGYNMNFLMCEKCKKKTFEQFNFCSNCYKSF